MTDSEPSAKAEAYERGLRRATERGAGPFRPRYQPGQPVAAEHAPPPRRTSRVKEG